MFNPFKEIRVWLSTDFPTETYVLTLIMRATRGRASKYRPGRGLNQGEEGLQSRPPEIRLAVEWSWHSDTQRHGTVGRLSRADIFELVR